MRRRAGSPRRSGAGGDHAAHRCLAIVYRPIKDLKLNSKNPRRHDKRQIKQIAQSIRAFRFNVPVLVDATGEVVAGHGRVLAAELIGMTEVPTICLEHLTEAQARAFLLADNKLCENAEWDPGLLREQLKALSEVELDFTLEATGFTMGEIDLIIEGAASSEGSDDSADLLPSDSAAPAVTKLGDLWLAGSHRVLCGDARKGDDYLRLMEHHRAHAVFIDGPYNLELDENVTGFGKVHYPEFVMGSGEMTDAEFKQFLQETFTQLALFSRDGALVYVFMDWRHTAAVLGAAEHIFTEFKNLCIWIKGAGGQGSFYRSAHELVFVFKSGRGKHRNNFLLGQYGRYRTNVWSYPRVSGFSRAEEDANLTAVHPTIKPVALVADAILDSTARREIVLDTFLGSGTTLIAAERVGRTCYGMEIEPRFVDVAIRRCQSFTGQLAIHAESGRTFNEMEEEANERKQ